MPKAYDLLMQGRGEELWQMCCGFLDLDIDQFMEIQERLLLRQLELLNNSELGHKLFRGKKPRTMEEFRRFTQITTYKDYCPELSEKRIECLPEKAEMWAHTSGRSGDFTCKWIPFTREYLQRLSVNLYGIGMISCAEYRGDTSRIPREVKLLYSVAPRPYISGTFADVLQEQTPLEYLPSLEEAEKMTYEKRIAEGFQQALSKGLDYFFGLSMVLVKVGEKLQENSSRVKMGPYLRRPVALYRLVKGLIKSKLERRSILPRDIWNIKGIIGSGVDSWVYKDKIKQLWGRNPLDLYACTEGGVIATQVWDYSGMTFFPDLNFLEFIPEEEQIKLNMDRTYIPRTLLLDEVRPGETYEIIVTSFHGGAVVRYRIGDLVKITSLSNEKLGIKTPQMAFERRADNVIDFVFVRLTEKAIWQAIEKAGVPYNDWIAYRKTGTAELQIHIEPKISCALDTVALADFLYKELTRPEEGARTLIPDEYAAMMDFKVTVEQLPQGSFTRYTAYKEAQGADLAHIKPPHLNPPETVLSLLFKEVEENIIIKNTNKAAQTENTEKIAVSD